MKNRMVKEKRLGIAILAIGLAALLVLTACAPPATPLLEEGKIVEIGSLCGLTGGAAGPTQFYLQGMLDYVRYFNEEKGIPGVTIKLVWMDVAGVTDRFISGYYRLVGRGVPFIHGEEARALEGLRLQLERDQIVFIGSGMTGALIYPPGWVFSTWSLQAEEASAVFDYFMENWKEERPPRLQFVMIDIPWGHEILEGTKYAESIGFEVLPTEPCPYVILDAIPQLLRIREREADLVYVQHIVPGTGPILRDAERLGLQDVMQFAGSKEAMGEVLIATAPAGVEGFLSARPLPWFDETEIPGIRTMIDIQERYHGKVQERPEYMGGWACGAIMCEAIKGALEEVAYENLDGAAVKRALERMDLDLDGMARFTFGPEDRRGTRNYAVYQVQGGKIVRVSDWQEVPILVP
jgi:ABC-type branched-subunit amino acid transport system substrate-binding protein